VDKRHETKADSAMNLTEEARRLLTCDELRGRVPDEVQKFLREVAGLEPVAYRYVDHRPWMDKPAIGYTQNPDEFGIPDMLESLYTLEPRHDQP